MKMNPIWYLLLLGSCLGFCQTMGGKNITSRPAVVNIGAIFTYQSTIGRVAKIAIEEAVKDVNSDPSILPGTTLALQMSNSNCSGFLGMVEALKFMESDIVAVIGPQCSVVSHIISYIANELQVPLLSFAATDPTLVSLQFPFFVRTTQSDVYQMEAVAAIVDHYGWRQVIAIFIDDDYGRNGIAALDDKLAERRCRISYKVAIQPDLGIGRGEIMNILVKLALMESRIVVLHVNPTLGFSIFSVARYLEMMGNGYVWIATDWLASALDSKSPLAYQSMEDMQGVLVLRQHTPDSKRKRAFLSRWNKITGGSPGLSSYGLYAYDSVFVFAHAMDAFFNQGGVVSFSSSSKLNSSNLHLDAMSIFNDGNLLLKEILQSNIIGLTGRLKFDSDRSLVRPAYDIINVIGTGIRRIGYWSNYSGLSIVPPESLRAPNFSSESQKLQAVIWPGDATSIPRGWVFPNNGKLLRIGVPVRVSFREFVSRVRGTDTFKGFCIDVFMAAVNLLPYAVPYRFIPFGDGVANPSYTELVSMITTGSFDGVVGDIAIVTNRTKRVDFTQPFAASGLVVVAPFRKLNSGAWAFLHPFTPFMWTITGCSCVVIGIVVWILEHRINDDFRGPPKRQLITVLWFSFSTMFTAHRENTVSTLARGVLIIWLFVVLIINSSYTASLTSILTVQQLSSHIKGIDSLRKSDDPIGFQIGSFAEYYLNQELNISKSRLIPLGSPEAFAKALKDGPDKGGVAAIVDERLYVELFLSSQCTFRVVGPEFAKSSWGFAFPRDSPLAVDLSTAILELAENGDLQRIHDKWLMPSTCNLEGAEIESDRLHLRSFWGLFLVCGIACSIALLIYFMNLVHQWRSITTSESVSTHQSVSRSGHLRRFLSLMDEKEDPSKHKRRKTETSSVDHSRDNESAWVTPER